MSAHRMISPTEAIINQVLAEQRARELNQQQQPKRPRPRLGQLDRTNERRVAKLEARAHGISGKKFRKLERAQRGGAA